MRKAQHNGLQRAAVFRSRPSRSRVSNALTSWQLRRYIATSRAGLLIAKSHYDALGGHRASDTDPDAASCDALAGGGSSFCAAGGMLGD